MDILSNPKHHSPGKILLVDDDLDIRNIYREYLTQAGFVVDEAVDGEQGLAKILQGGYDLVLLDIMLPKIDGLRILKKLNDKKKDNSVYQGHIIVLSALRQESVLKEAMALGAKGYIVKSDVTPKDILDKVVELTNNPS